MWKNAQLRTGYGNMRARTARRAIIISINNKERRERHNRPMRGKANEMHNYDQKTK
jgi:hypothetical protein